MKLWKSIEESFVKWAVPTIAAGIVFGVITVSELVTANAQQQRVNERVEKDVSSIKQKVDTMTAVPIIQAEKIRNLEGAIQRVETSQKETAAKLDRLIELMIEAKTSPK